MKQLNIVIREVKNGTFKGSQDIVLLDFEGRSDGNSFEVFGNIGDSNTGYCHSIADYDYLKEKTKTLEEKNARRILNSLKAIYNDFEIVIHKRLTKKYLSNN